MKRLGLAALGALLLAAPAANAETKSYNFNSFTRLNISAGYEVIFTQGAQRSVTIDAADFNKVVVEQKGDTLRIGRPKNTNTRKADIVRITAPDLERIDLAAGIEFRTASLNVDKLEIDLSAGVTFVSDAMTVDTLALDLNAGVKATLRSLKAQTVTLDANSGSSATLEGTCGRFEVEGRAGTSVYASNFRCREAVAEGAAGASLRVNASEKVTADAGVGSSIKVAGDPKSVDKHASIGGRVSIE